MFKMLFEYNRDCMSKDLNKLGKTILSPFIIYFSWLFTVLEYYFSSPQALEATLYIIIEHNKGKVN